ncbi:UNVERIFIED_CONTAM: hypothetical protein DV031_16730 [Lacticaseibacillus paracasei]|nr:hypothetical protein [Lacticaseibacillus paracasei]
MDPKKNKTTTKKKKAKKDRWIEKNKKNECKRIDNHKKSEKVQKKCIEDEKQKRRDKSDRDTTDPA